jgi:hypothetical protein
MLWVGFVPTIPVFEGAKLFNAVDRAAAVIRTGDIGSLNNYGYMALKRGRRDGEERMKYGRNELLFMF